MLNDASVQVGNVAAYTFYNRQRLTLGQNIIEYYIIIKASGKILFLKLLALSLCNCFHSCWC